MGKIKGCGNESCEAHEKKLKYKESEAYCSKCGSPLVYVCKDCYTQLRAEDDKYCVRCLAKRKDKFWKISKDTAKVGGGTLGVGSVIYGVIKAIDWVKKIKG